MLGVIDRYKKPEKSRLFLCKPNRQIVAELSEAYGKEIKTSYNGIHELSFSIPYKVTKNNKSVVNPNFHLIKGDYLIKYVEGSDEEYFVIDKPSNSGSDTDVKTVQCYLLPYSLRKKLVRNYKGTKKLYDPVGTDGFLNDTLIKKTNWSVGYVDADLMTKFRTVDVSEQSLIEFIESLNDAFGSIAIWNTKDKKVSFYKENSFGADKGLIIEQGKYLKAISEEPDFDSVATRIYVYGKDEITFNAYNPTGTDFIESYDYYMHPFERDVNRNVIKESFYMSNGLCHALLDYQLLVSSKQGSFVSLISQKATKQTTLTTKENELTILEIDLAIIQDQIDVKKALSQDYSTLESQRVSKVSEITVKTSEVNTVKSEITTIDTQINQIKTEVSMEANFTTEQIVELNEDVYIREKIINNQYIADEKELYDFAKSEIVKLSQPLIHYSIDIVDFTKVVQCQRDWDKLNYGDIVTVRYPKFNIDIKARIISIVKNEDNNSVSIEIANSKDINSGFLTIKDLYQKAATSSTTIEMSKPKWDKSEQNAESLYNIINNEYDATKQRIVAGVDESVELSRKGIIIKNPSFPSEMLIAQAGVLALSQDGGNTWKTAIKPDRIVADVVMGKLIAGVNLTIENESAKYKIDGNGFVITSNDNKKKVLLDVNDGLKFQVKEGSVFVDKFYYDTTNNRIAFKGELDADELKVKGVSVLTGDKTKIDSQYISDLTADKITTGTLTGVTINGVTINGATINGGTINVTSNITVGDRIYLGTQSNQGYKFISFTDGSFIYHVEGVIGINAPEIRLFGTTTIAGEMVATRPWVQANSIAKLG